MLKPILQYKNLKAFILITSLLFLAAACSNDQETHEPTAGTHVGLGTASRITIYDQPEDRAENTLGLVFDRIDEIEARMSLYDEQSEINQVNRHSGTGTASVSEDTYQVLKLAKEVAESSGGAFDPTVGPLITEWGFSTDEPKVPSGERIASLTELVDYRKLNLSREGEAELLKEGMKLDLGGIAKGYAADEANRIIREEGSSSALVNLGGNIMLVGEKPDGTPWRIGIQDPESHRGDYVLILFLDSGTVVTSGIYERFFHENDTMYHHLLDTKTGYPAENNLESVTIVTENSAYADAVSTAAFILGLDGGWDYLESLEGTEGIFLTRDKDVYMTSGFGPEGIDYTLSDESYEIRTGAPGT